MWIPTGPMLLVCVLIFCHIFDTKLRVREVMLPSCHPRRTATHEDQLLRWEVASKLPKKLSAVGPVGIWNCGIFFSRGDSRKWSLPCRYVKNDKSLRKEDTSALMRMIYIFYHVIRLLFGNYSKTHKFHPPHPPLSTHFIPDLIPDLSFALRQRTAERQHRADLLAADFLDQALGGPAGISTKSSVVKKCGRFFFIYQNHSHLSSFSSQSFIPGTHLCCCFTFVFSILANPKFSLGLFSDFVFHPFCTAQESRCRSQLKSLWNRGSMTWSLTRHRRRRSTGWHM